MLILQLFWRPENCLLSNTCRLKFNADSFVLTWLQGFQDNIANFLSFHCEVLQFPKKKTGYKENTTKYTMEKFVLRAFKAVLEITSGCILNMSYYRNLVSVNRRISELTFKYRTLNNMMKIYMQWIKSISKLTILWYVQIKSSQVYCIYTCMLSFCEKYSPASLEKENTCKKLKLNMRKTLSTSNQGGISLKFKNEIYYLQN